MSRRSFSLPRHFFLTPSRPTLVLCVLRQRGHAAIVQALIHHKADIDGQVGQKRLDSWGVGSVGCAVQRRVPWLISKRGAARNPFSVAASVTTAHMSTRTDDHGTECFGV